MISKLLCWLGFYDWKCLYRNYTEQSEMTGWACMRCNSLKHEQWDY